MRPDSPVEFLNRIHEGEGPFTTLLDQGGFVTFRRSNRKLLAFNGTASGAAFPKLGPPVSLDNEMGRTSMEPDRAHPV